jgi:cyclophilin family peptidyl-prolyl cis-trans isomerase
MKHKKMAISVIVFLIFISGMIVYSTIYAPRPPASIAFVSTAPTNSTYSFSSIPVILTTDVTGGTLDKIWYNCKNGTSWIYASNQTYTVSTYMANFMTDFVNGSQYIFYAWANATDGTLVQLSNSFSVTRVSSRIMLVTNMGSITIDLFDDMPISSGNFKNLTQFGIYNGTLFHRVATSPAVIQGGDASSKGTTVMPIQDELPNKHSNVRGSVAMAKTSSPNSATSQFYINVQDNTSLDSNYSVFGNVTAGMDIVDLISKVAVDSNEKPLQDVVITQAIVLA